MDVPDRRQWQLHRSHGPASEPTSSSSTDPTGNLTIGGTLTELQPSVKTDFEPIDPREVLSKVDAPDIPAWRYKNDPGSRHIGPMAEDFWAAFGLGRDDAHIALTDKAGVALAAIKGLNQVVQQKDAEIEDLKARIEKLESALAVLTAEH